MKPDQLGRFKLEDLSATRASESPAPIARSPWLMALGGAVVGAIINSVVMNYGDDKPSSRPAEAQAAQESDRPSPHKTASAPSEPRVAPLPQRQAEARPVETLPRPAAKTVSQPVKDGVVPPAAKRQLVRHDAGRTPPPAMQDDVSIVPIEHAGAMVPMAGPEEAEPASGLRVIE